MAVAAVIRLRAAFRPPAGPPRLGRTRLVRNSDQFGDIHSKRLVVGLISIFLRLLVLVQSCAVATTAGLAQDTATGDAGAVGIVVALLFFIGGAFSFGRPMVASLVLVLEGLLALLGGGAFGDLRI